LEKLYNTKSKDELIAQIEAETFKRVTCSFYCYKFVKNPQSLRDDLFRTWMGLKVLGRTYIAEEGLNAQISVPEIFWDDFIATFEHFDILKNVIPNRAIKDGVSFFKLIIKVRKEIVSFSLSSNEYDMRKVGNHLSAKDFNKLIEEEESIVIDMRNQYESTVGHFRGAHLPKTKVSKDLLPEVENILRGRKNKKILLYCTGGIRCEKASSYLLNKGYKDVNQLKGGIINYARNVKENGLESKFIGKNFVFDNRMGERVTDDLVAECSICGLACDDYTDCLNQKCHVLFIQCKDCGKELNGCCSKMCQAKYSNQNISTYK
tara:strand:- start:2134 stop:3090 length:957 start_codon:yes stop_codon:yes gene_type:complete